VTPSKETTIDDQNSAPATLICLCGGNGSGKTRILRALAQEVGDPDNPDKALLVGAEAFVDEILNAILRADVELVRQKYRGVQTLLIDNLWILQNRPAAAEEFCRLIAGRQQNAKSTVVASETPIEEWGTLNKAVAALLANAVIYNV
jgi:chromosomal replication initiator protein